MVFDASGSSDSDGSIVTYQWIFGDGFTGAGRSKEHTYDVQGQYAVTLRVVDDDGRSSMMTVTIDVARLPIGQGQGGSGVQTSDSRTGSASSAIQPRLDLAVGSAVGMRAPEFSLPTFDDGIARLSDYLGSPVIVEFWSSACNGCRTAMPHLEALRRQYQPLGLTVITISVDPSPSDARRFLAQGGYTGFVALRESDPTNKVTMHAYGVSWIPHAFLIDRQGVVRFSGLHGRAERGADRALAVARIHPASGLISHDFHIRLTVS